MRRFLAPLQLAYHFIVPIAGCILVQMDGPRFGPWGALGIAIGLFVYSYLQWALVATERLSGGASRIWILQLVGIVLIGVLVRANWKDWIIEQMFLEAVSFSLGIAVLALYKAGKEQHEKMKPPWFLIILVFCLPAGLLVWYILPAWLHRHSEAPTWEWLVFGLAFLIGVGTAFRTMKPFAMADDHLVEPLDRGWKIGFIAVWLIFLLCVLVWLADKG